MYVDKKLKKCGGSVMLPIPPAILKALRVTAGAEVRMQIDDENKLIITPVTGRYYKLAELLASCDLSCPIELARDSDECPSI